MMTKVELRPLMLMGILQSDGTLKIKNKTEQKLTMALVRLNLNNG